MMKHIRLFFVVVSLVAMQNVSQAAKEIPIITDGKPRAVTSNLSVTRDSSGWETKDGAFQATGVGNYLYSDYEILEGDFVISAKLRMLKQKKSAAGFAIGNGHLGFEGAKAEELFLSGALFGGYKSLGKSSDFFPRGEWIDFVVQRSGEKLTFTINEKQVYQTTAKLQPSIRFGFTPHRSTMHIQELSLTGKNLILQISKPRGYPIPLIDLAAEKHRQVIVDREAGQYLGHPTTVVLDDKKTMLIVYPKGHGRGPIVMKRSTDGGKTWSKRLPVPENWATSKEVPTLYPVVDSAGKKRIIMFSGLYPIRMAVSEDEGESWSPLKPIGDFGGIVAMSDIVRLKDGKYMTLFHDDGRFISEHSKQKNPVVFDVFKSVSADGGLTWSAPEVVATHKTAHLCEPGIVRSPDGKQIAVLLRENSRRHNSFLILSDDEGKTWTKPKELPAALTGDRHQAVYTADGRLFISFRDTTHVSPTKGDWVGWVGTYDDIIKGKEGQYRVRLMDNHKGADCAYPAMEIFPDGTIVATTYGHWTPDEPAYIVSVRFTMDELDAKFEKLKSTK